MTRSDIVAEARKWIGTRFRHQGRQIGVGVDCAGLVLGVAKSLGLGDFEFVTYGREPVGKLQQMCDEHMVRACSIEPGNVLLMRFGSEPQHLAIVGDYYNGGESLIHAASQFGRVIEHRLSQEWRRKIVAAYTYKGIV